MPHSIAKDALIIGLTGSFGSGCTTVSKALEQLGFSRVSLSEFVRKEWKKRNPKKKIENARRSELQDIGNELRQKFGNDYLAKKALEEARKSKGPRMKRVVFDSIRNTAELAKLRTTFPNFFLVAVDALPKNRWDRVKSDYNKWGLTEHNFLVDDERDKNEAGIVHGQQVQQCTDEADILIGNDEYYPDETVAISNIIEKIDEPYVRLLSGEKTRSPTPDESYMSMAYTASLLSKCVKRQVGAVILDSDGSVLSVGYNENPIGKKPCVEAYKRCYRDIYKSKLFRDLQGQPCPSCHKDLGKLSSPFICPNCRLDLDRFYVRDKALSRCTALHAEEKAIIQAGGRNLNGSTMYATTFPCCMCAHKIIDVGLETILYAEPYPDPEAARVLEESEGVFVERFEGVKSRAYFRLFGSWRKEMEAKMAQGT